MTEEEMKAWFKNAEKFSPQHSILSGNFASTHYEDLYQAFKSRLKSEATLNVWPDVPVESEG